MQRFKKQIVLILAFTVFLPSLFSLPKKTEALFPVADLLNTLFHTQNAATSIAAHTKTYVLDTIATNVAKNIIKQLTAQTVNWINSGYKGNPAYVTDPKQFFLNVGDAQAAQFLSSNGALSSLCSPFQAKVRLALAKSYLQETSATNYSCSLGRIEQNFDNFTNDFNQGGWDGWFSMTQNVTNNPYGAYIKGKDELTINIGNQTANYNKQLDMGRGFLNYEVCKKNSPIAGQVAATNGTSATTGTQKQVCKAGYIPFGEPNGGNCKAPLVWVTLDSNGNEIDSKAVDAGIGEGDCTEKETVTPGSVIESKLEGVLGTDIKQLELVQSINQIVSALITQLTQQVVGGVGNGLRGLSQGTPSNSSNRSLLQQLSNGSTENAAENAQVQSKIKQNDSIPPTITLVGDNPMIIPVGTLFVEPGVLAADITDGDLSKFVISVPSTINTSIPGTYTITYMVTNSAGISSKIVTRTVNVGSGIVSPVVTPPITP